MESQHRASIKKRFSAHPSSLRRAGGGLRTRLMPANTQEGGVPAHRPTAASAAAQSIARTPAPAPPLAPRRIRVTSDPSQKPRPVPALATRPGASESRGQKPRPVPVVAKLLGSTLGLCPSAAYLSHGRGPLGSESRTGWPGSPRGSGCAYTYV